MIPAAVVAADGLSINVDCSQSVIEETGHRGPQTLNIGRHIKEFYRIRACMANLIVKSAVKEELDEKDVASDFYGALDEEVEELLANAARRAEQNDRKTVQPRDL
jgi:histone H3/H4